MHRDRAAALFGGLVLVPACGSSHIEGTKVCRRYPTAFNEGGRPDDSARRMDASNGESVTVDANVSVGSRPWPRSASSGTSSIGLSDSFRNE
jgi:hypothetical protein